MSRKAAGRIVGIGALVLLLGVGLWWALREPPRITVATWGGDYARAQASAMFEPYADDSGIDVVTRTYGGGLAELTRQVETGRPEWDVVDMRLADAAEACRKGLIETINHATLPKGDNGSPAAGDFIPGALGPCWVGSVVHSQIIAFDPKRFPQALPVRAADFFDLVKFPGGRGMQDSPRGNLELALIGDGVPAKGVYEVLSTPEGVARAFAKLDGIRPAIFWWKVSTEPLAMLTDGRAAMTTAPNAVVTGGAVFGVIWDGQRYEFNVFAVPRGTPRREKAFDFVRFATGTVPLARVSELGPNGPARLSSLAQIALPERRGSLPTAHLENALNIDPNWWAVQGPAIEARWREWRLR